MNSLREFREREVDRNVGSSAASTSMCSSQAEGEALVIATSEACTLPRLRSSRTHRSDSTTSARGSAHSSPRTARGACGSAGSSRPRNQLLSASPAVLQETSSCPASETEKRSPQRVDIDEFF